LSDEAENLWWREHFISNRGLLHQIHFHRLVLDEAQAIKNPKSAISRACRTLRATHRWLMTGTPLTDSINEVYPLMKFLKAPFTGNLLTIISVLTFFNITIGDLKTFRKNYCNRQDLYHPLRLNCLANTYMYRRTGWDQLLGVQIQQLPNATIRTIELNISKPELVLQQVIIRKFKKECEASDSERTKNAAVLGYDHILCSAEIH
jgi:SNF2 family DNA or RNA helicase